HIADMLFTIDDAEKIKPALAQFCGTIFTSVIMADTLVADKRQRLTIEQKWQMYRTFKRIPGLKLKTKLLFWCPWLVKVKKMIVG
ncbi:TPA: hypothetical protein ACSP15_004072, partial [Aeromonas veronii]